MSSLTAFLIAVGGVSLICFGLMVRADRIRDRRRAYANGASDTGGIASGNESFGLLSWFSSSSSSSDNPCTTSDSWSSGSWSDSSSCSDGGGGGDSGGGGGD